MAMSPSAVVDRFVEIDGLRLNTRRRPGPEGPTLLLLHGIGGSLEAWGTVLEAFPHRDVLMVDAPGAGRSDVPKYPLRVGGVADVIVAAARELGVDQADVLGFSLGGAFAQEVVHRHPDFVRRLVLVATMSGAWFRMPKPSAVRALASTSRYRSREAAEKQIPMLAGGRSARDPEVLAAILDEREGTPPTERGYRFQQLSVMGWTSLPWLRRIKAPTLVLLGEEDPIIHVSTGSVLARRIPGARREIVPGAGHMLLFDEPERSLPIVAGFLTADGPKRPMSQGA
ncbi:MAG: alpha/beta hydrolase [Tetrasphaera sp.]